MFTYICMFLDQFKTKLWTASYVEQVCNFSVIDLTFFLNFTSLFIIFLAVRTKMVYCKIDQTQQKVVVR